MEPFSTRGFIFLCAADNLLDASIEFHQNNENSFYPRWPSVCRLKTNRAPGLHFPLNLNYSINFVPPRLVKLLNAHKSSRTKQKALAITCCSLFCIKSHIFLVFLLFVSFSTASNDVEKKEEEEWKKEKKEESKRLRTIECSALADLVSFTQRLHLFGCVRWLNRAILRRRPYNMVRPRPNCGKASMTN